MSRSLSARTVILLGCVGSILGFAIVVGYRPELLPPSIATPLNRQVGTVDIRTTILGAGGLLACIGLLGSWLWRTTDRTNALSDVSVETPDREVAVTGGSLTREFEQRREEGYRSENVIEVSLRGALVAHFGHEFADAERAAAHVDDGEWTDDQVAAATLTATGAVDFPLGYRLYAWLYPGHAYGYRIRRTLRVVEDTCGAALTGYSPPERTRGKLGRLRVLFGSESGGERE